MATISRQSFLGDDSENILRRVVVGIIGLGGGGSQVAQQLAHIGINGYVLVDHDRIDREGTNLNRLVGATAEDVVHETLKTQIASRLIKSIRPGAKIDEQPYKWNNALAPLRTCTVIFGCVDSYVVRDEIEKFCRRNLIAFIDIGMDVRTYERGYAIGGQAVLSHSGTPCLRCLGIVTDDRLHQEAGLYGQAGPRPQVIWPNAILASTAVAFFIQLVTPWHSTSPDGGYVEYNGNLHTLGESNRMPIARTLACKHYMASEVGDPFFSL